MLGLLRQIITDARLPTGNPGTGPRTRGRSMFHSVSHCKCGGLLSELAHMPSRSSCIRCVACGKHGPSVAWVAEQPTSIDTMQALEAWHRQQLIGLEINGQPVPGVTSIAIDVDGGDPRPDRADPSQAPAGAEGLGSNGMGPRGRRSG